MQKRRERREEEGGEQRVGYSLVYTIAHTHTCARTHADAEWGWTWMHSATFFSVSSITSLTETKPGPFAARPNDTEPMYFTTVLKAQPYRTQASQLEHICLVAPQGRWLGAANPLFQASELENI